MLLRELSPLRYTLSEVNGLNYFFLIEHENESLFGACFNKVSVKFCV